MISLLYDGALDDSNRVVSNTASPWFDSLLPFSRLLPGA